MKYHSKLHAMGVTGTAPECRVGDQLQGTACQLTGGPPTASQGVIS